MSHITHPDLLFSGLALSASSLTARSAWARAAALLGGNIPEGSAAVPAVSPREELLFDFGWKFIFGQGSGPFWRRSSSRARSGRVIFTSRHKRGAGKVRN